MRPCHFRIMRPGTGSSLVSIHPMRLPSEGTPVGVAVTDSVASAPIPCVRRGFRCRRHLFRCLRHRFRAEGAEFRAEGHRFRGFATAFGAAGHRLPRLGPSAHRDRADGAEFRAAGTDFRTVFSWLRHRFRAEGTCFQCRRHRDRAEGAQFRAAGHRLPCLRHRFRAESADFRADF